MGRVQPQNLPKQGVGFLTVAKLPMLVAGPAAIAQADIQHAIGAEGDHAAVVVGFGLVHLQQHPFAGAVECAVGAKNKIRQPVAPLRQRTGRLGNIQGIMQKNPFVF